MSILRGVFNALAVGLNTVGVFSLMMPPTLLKRIFPSGPVRRACDHLLNALASGWVGNNNAWIAASSRSAWDVQGVDGLDRRGWYLISCNHQSWVDILVLQRVFHGRVPFLKFFLKAQLIWVPVIGLAWWALDFPFLKRGKGRNSRESDLKSAREACEKFKLIPTSVISFFEGTRFTPAKQAEQGSPYRHLLKPKIGSLGVALATMGEQFQALLDVTIVYRDGAPTFWDLLSGRLGPVSVRVRVIEIPRELVEMADHMLDRGYRRRLTAWVEQQWQEKDALIDELLAQAPPVRAG
ncbi:acyltransferase [Rubrivivax gelatinosus]|uniref:Acyltransferase n=1 Tax=Rubrivivax gelatinosus TaxID=28068 RepID=A0ABS1DW75_RUBGE|nr:acyltransferase [Rubrivivax gelatinosus]MBK1615156.1 acyltransferase [Rubrivivax gelatinosus]MBK1713753.1 acyltransferase [Rubrivivax gelatinosus]